MVARMQFEGIYYTGNINPKIKLLSSHFLFLSEMDARELWYGLINLFHPSINVILCKLYYHCSIIYSIIVSETKFLQSTFMTPGIQSL